MAGMQDIIGSFAIALGFEVNKGQLDSAKRSLADYEKAVRESDARIEKAKAAGAKASVRYALEIEAAAAREALEVAKAAKKVEDTEKEQARKRQARHQEFIAGWNRAAIAATAAAAAIGYAVNKVTSAFDNLGFVSARTGASVQGLNSLSYAFRQVGGSSQQAIGLVERFAQAVRGNDGLKAMLKGYGIDTSKGTDEQVLDTVAKLGTHGYQVGMREAGLFGIGEEDFKLVTDYLSKIRDYRAEYNRTTRSLGVDSGKAAEASQSFQRSLTKLQATASALTDKLMISLAPALEAIVKRFNDWIEAHPEQVQKIVDDIAKGLGVVATKFQEFADWMIGGGGDQLLKRWEDFATRVERVARGIEIISKVVGFVGANSGVREYGGVAGGPGRTAEILDGLSEDKRNLWQRVMPKALGGKDAPIPGGTARIGRLAQNANAKTIIGELRSAGYNDNAIAAIVGSMQTESGLNPAVPQNSYNRGHTGLWQWDTTRWPKIAKWITDRKGDPFDAAWQTRAWIAEHNAKPGDPIYDGRETSRGGAMLRNNPSIDDAIRGVRASERFGAGEEGGRAANARGWLPHLSAPSATATMPRPTFSPGAFDPNNIDPKNLMTPAPAGGDVTNNSSSSRSVVQHITNHTTITGADRPRESARIMEAAFGRMHGLAIQNAQSATV